MNKKEITIKSPINIALIKYWGKLEKNFNIPLNSSFSLTLSRKTLYSLTKMKISDKKKDTFTLKNKTGKIIETNLPRDFHKLKKFFTNFSKTKKLTKTDFYLKIESINNFPTKAGLASSASGICALGLAFSRLTNFFEENEEEIERDIFENIKAWVLEKNIGKIVRVQVLVLLLRICSGSSARSVFLFPVFSAGPEIRFLDQEFEKGEDIREVCCEEKTINENNVGVFNNGDNRVKTDYNNDFDNIEEKIDNDNEDKIDKKNIEGFKSKGDKEKRFNDFLDSNREIIIKSIEIYKKYCEDIKIDEEYFTKLSPEKFYKIKKSDIEKVNFSCQAFPLINYGKKNHKNLKNFFSKIKVVSILIKKEKKKIGSRKGMLNSALTSQNLIFRIKNFKKKVINFFEIINNLSYKDFFEFVIKESNNFHSICLDTFPPLFYLKERSFEIINRIFEFNLKFGVVSGYSFDAGPNPFVFVKEEFLERFLKDVRALGVLEQDLIISDVEI